jgi:hypothetical protein
LTRWDSRYRVLHLTIIESYSKPLQLLNFNGSHILLNAKIWVSPWWQTRMNCSMGISKAVEASSSSTRYIIRTSLAPGESLLGNLSNESRRRAMQCDEKGQTSIARARLELFLRPASSTGMHCTVKRTRTLKNNTSMWVYFSSDQHGYGGDCAPLCD